MSGAGCTAEQFDRWHKRDCARCGRFGCFTARWPDGYVCRGCHDRALRTRGRCPGCAQERALPGRRTGDGVAICTGCAAFGPAYDCSRCGREDKLYANRLCERCTFTDRLTGLLDDGTGQIRPELVPLFDMLAPMNRPGSGLAWLEMRKNQPGSAANLLQHLGLGQIAVTHHAFHELQPWRTASHLEQLLMACSVLPAIDKQICSFERWLPGYLDTVTDLEHVKVLRRYATWEVLQRLRAQPRRGPITPSIRRFAGDQVKHAAAFLDWLARRGRVLGDCRQADIDAWFVEHPSPYAGTCTRPFLRWCAGGKLTARLTLPAVQIGRTAPLTQAQRLGLLGQVLTDPGRPSQIRVAAMIVLLFAQPLTKVVLLTVDDVIRDGEQVFLRLGEPPSPVPEPAASLLLDYAANRQNMNTATNRESRWLFPGRRAGQPLRPDYLSALLNKIGVPVAASRGAAIRQHVLEMPAPVVADALGYHHVTTTRLAAEAGTIWSRYAPGDHRRLPSQAAGQRTGDS